MSGAAILWRFDVSQTDNHVPLPLHQTVMVVFRTQELVADSQLQTWRLLLFDRLNTCTKSFFLKRLFKKKVENSRLKPDAIGKTQPTNYCNKILSQTGPVRLTITKWKYEFKMEFLEHCVAISPLGCPWARKVRHPLASSLLTHLVVSSHCQNSPLCCRLCRWGN